MAGPRLVLDVIRRDHVDAADGGREGGRRGVEGGCRVIVRVRVLQDGGRACGADKGGAGGVVGGLENIGDLVRRGGDHVAASDGQRAADVDVAGDVEGGGRVRLADGEVAAGGEVDVGAGDHGELGADVGGAALLERAREVDVADDVESRDGVGLADGEVGAGGQVHVRRRCHSELGADVRGAVLVQRAREVDRADDVEGVGGVRLADADTGIAVDGQGVAIVVQLHEERQS